MQFSEVAASLGFHFDDKDLFRCVRPYSYQALPDYVNHIRLIELLPPNDLFPDLILFELQTYRFADAPAYHSLSYTWGDEKPL